MNQPADTNDLPVRVRRAAWLARAAFLLVFAINVQCAASFVLWPDVYAPSFVSAGWFIPISFRIVVRST